MPPSMPPYACPRCGPTEALPTSRGSECKACGRLLDVSPAAAVAPPTLPRPVAIDRYTPFVSTRLELVWVPDVPADLECFFFGLATTYRLTPAVYAHLFHAAELRCSRPDLDPETATQLIAALDRVYTALVAVYDPADVHPWSPATPPLPLPPRVLKDDDGIPGRLPDFPASTFLHGSSPTTPPARPKPKTKPKPAAAATLFDGG